MTKIGVIGGTFDPVHLGHLAVADEAMRQVGLAEMIFVPAGHPYFKAAARISSAEHRIKMLELAIANMPHYKISLLEIQRPGPSYAVETIAKMKSQFKTEDEIFFIMGWDSLLTLPRWEQPEWLISLCKIIAAPRPGFSKPDINLIEKDLPGISQRTIVMEKPQVDISATEIRERVRRGLPIEDMVPPLVARYIKENRLYMTNANREDKESSEPLPFVKGD
jgi:nicotinate-nucleotide adenylyltransferase